ncbi:MAG TPA: acyltransferase family protein, partial [Mycobacterium sp.]
MPDNRDHAMDLYRVVALLTIVVGHWVAACLTFSDGAFWRENPLVDLPWTQWLTWIFQVVPVFFVVAGYASAVSWGHRRAEESLQDWLRRRLARPVGPTAVYVVCMLIVVAVLSAVGVAGAELDFGAWAVAMHLWFLGIYVLVVALTPIAVAAHRRWGLWVPTAMVVVVAAIDAATLGAHLPYAGWLNYLLPWAVLYQFGIAWQDEMLRGRAALTLAAVSAVALALLIRLGPYPISMIGVPGATVNNTSPPNLALLALG